MSKEISKEKRIIIYNKYKGRCAYCGCKIDYNNMHVDHIIPRQRGYNFDTAKINNIIKGTNKIDNLNPSCPTCNISKSIFSIKQWRNEIKLKVDRVRRSNANIRLLESFGILKYINKDVIFYFEKHNI